MSARDVIRSSIAAIDGASYRLFRQARYDAWVIAHEVGHAQQTDGGNPAVDRVVGILTQPQEKDLIPKGAVFFTSCHNGNRKLEWHDTAKPHCNQSCGAWVLGDRGRDDLAIESVDLENGAQSRLTGGTYSAALRNIKLMLSSVAFSHGCSLNIPACARGLRFAEDGSITCSAGGQPEVAAVLQTNFGHTLAFESSKGFLAQVRSTIKS